MAILSDEQKSAFWRDGFLRVDDAITAQLGHELARDFSAWVEESRGHSGAYGQMLDGRPRFDVEPGHSAEHPALRRVASPTELSESYLSAITGGRATDAAAELLGPDLRFHHSKVNSKLPGAKTTVKWHQDFTFDPHSNDDLVTVILFIDDVTEQSGPPLVVPGSHQGDLHSLWHNGKFTGAVSEEVARECETRATPCTGPGGTAYLMHTRLSHASLENKSLAPRTLFIFNIGAADAVPLSPCAVPSRHQGMIIRGREPGKIRCTEYEMECPEIPQGASFFVQQAQR